jgi:hypothetical protein
VSEPESSSASSSQESAGGAFCFFTKEEEDFEGVGLRVRSVRLLSRAEGGICVSSWIRRLCRRTGTFWFCHFGAIGEEGGD